jgi:hypothetical protein
MQEKLRRDMQTQNTHPTLTLILSLWAGVGPLVGLVAGHFLTRSWQAEQWSRDRRWQEYQELLKAVTSAYMAMIRLDAANKAMSSMPELVHETETVKHDSFRVIRDRIIIAGELAFADILGEWNAAVVNYDADKQERKFSERFKKLNERLVDMALGPPKFGGGLFLWRNRSKLAKYRDLKN